MNIQQTLALILPLALIGSMIWVFRAANRRWGYPLGYFIGYCVYWVVWCLLVPALLLAGTRSLFDLFTPFPALTSLDWLTQVLLWWPIIFPLAFIFLPRIRRASPAIVAASIVLGVIIGITEEILWRGVYLTLFHGNLWLAILYPSVMFAMWHIAPQSVVPNRMPGGAWSFVTYALVLGLSYAFAAERTGSIAWPAVSHIIHDSLGLGGFAYASWLSRKPARL